MEEQFDISYALAEPGRIAAARAEWRENPDKYVSEHFDEISNYDFPVYAAGNVVITTKKAKSVGFIHNRLQRILWRWMLEELAGGGMIRWYIVKARQLGCSTWILILFYWLCSLRENRRALIAAHDDKSVQTFNGRVTAMHAAGHHLLKPELKTANRNLIEFGTSNTKRKQGASPGLQSLLSFETADKPLLARSDTYQYVLLSEFAQWPILGIDIDPLLVSVYQAVPDEPGTIIIKETTGRGDNAAKDVWDDPENGYRKIFISWLSDETYRKALDPGQDLELCGAETISGNDTRYGNEVEETDHIRAELQVWYPEFCNDPQWMKTEILARLNWRRHMINTKCRGSKHNFRQEYPTCIEHAFGATGQYVFDRPSLLLMEKHVKEEGLNATAYRFLINDSEDKNEKFQQDEYGPLLVYKKPHPDGVYVIGGDVAQGIQNTGDHSTLLVLQVPELEEVASFNAIITPDIFAQVAYYLGLLYNKALLGLEDNDKGGWAANLILSTILYYPKLYYRFDPFDRKAAPKPGFNTNDTNKSVNVTLMGERIYDHTILFRTKALIEQCKKYVQLPDGSLGCPPPYKDDLVSAGLIATFLSTKVHLYKPDEPEIIPGSFEYEARRLAKTRGLRPIRPGRN